MLTFASEYLTKKLSKFVIGQKTAIETITSAVCENFEAFALKKPMKMNNILLMGPTGSGKTEIARNISKIISAPFLRTTMTDYTLTGYKGRDPQEIVAVDFKEIITHDHYKRICDQRSKFLYRKKAVEILKEIEVSPLKFIVALEFAAATVFLEEEEVIEAIFAKYGTRKEVADAIEDIRYTLKEVEKFYEIEKISEPMFQQKPFGIVFIDEIDKILIKERNDDAFFYRPLQEFILTMIEGTVVTSEDGKIDTSHITFILAGAFSQHSPEDFIPELKGRLNIKVKIRELQFEDYLKIAKTQKFEIPEVLKDKLVIVEPSALIEVARICEEMNRHEYLGARRLKEIISKVNRAIKWELQDFNALPITINASFVRWAVSFEPPNEEFTLPVPKELPKSSSSGKVSRSKIKEKVKDALIKDLVFKYEEIMKSLEHRLTHLGLFGHLKEVLTKKDSKGKSVLEYLVERGAIKEINRSTLSSLKKELGEKVIRRIKKSVKVTTEREFDSIDF